MNAMLIVAPSNSLSTSVGVLQSPHMMRWLPNNQMSPGTVLAGTRSNNVSCSTIGSAGSTMVGSRSFNSWSRSSPSNPVPSKPMSLLANSTSNADSSLSS